MLTPTPPSRSRGDNNFVMTASLMVISAVAIAFALSYTKPVMVPFVLAVFITYMVSPLVDVLRVKLKFPGGLAVFVTLLVVAALITLLGLLITTSVRGILENEALYRERLASLASQLFAFLERSGLPMGADIEESTEDLITSIRELPVVSWVGRAAGTMFGFITTGFLVLIFVIYLLIGKHPTETKKGIYLEIDHKVRRYLAIKMVISASTGLVVGTILWAFGLDLALVFGVLAFLLNFIPSVGSVIATLLPLPIALIQFDSSLAIAGVFLIPGAIQVGVGNVVEPLVMGEGLDLHPVTILMSLIFWGLLWGIVGMLLATPIMAVLKIVFSRLEITRPIAELFAGRLPQPATGEYAVAAPTEGDAAD
jgi:AI-2 transport protein TqsA